MSFDQVDLLSDSKYRQFVTAVEKALKSFEYSSEWADLISALGKLNKVLLSHQNFTVIPRKLTVSKRVSQCMHPALPSGVHLKALETYDLIFKRIGKKGLAQDLFIYSAGLFPLLGNAAMSIRPMILNVYENYFLGLGKALLPGLPGLLLGLLPGIEEGSEYTERTVSLLDSFSRVTDKTSFYSALWRCILMSASVRLPATTFLLLKLSKNKGVEQQSFFIGNDITCMMEACCASFQDSNILVQRNLLDFFLVFLPLHTNLLPTAQVVRLVSASLTVLLRRDMSLNRRLYAWILGTGISNKAVLVRADSLSSTDGPGDDASDYFTTFSKFFVTEAIRILFRNRVVSNGEEFGACSKKGLRMEVLTPFRILISLLDKPDIGPCVIEDVLLEVFRALYAHVQILRSVDGVKESISLSSRRDSVDSVMMTSRGTSKVRIVDELIKTANLLFNTFEPYFLWEFLAKLLTQCSNGSETKQSTVESGNEAVMSDKVDLQSGNNFIRKQAEKLTSSEMFLLTNFLLDIVEVEASVETQTEHWPELLRRLATEITCNCKYMDLYDLREGLCLCSKLLSKVMPSMRTFQGVSSPELSQQTSPVHVQQRVSSSAQENQATDETFTQDQSLQCSVEKDSVKLKQNGFKRQQNKGNTNRELDKGKEHEKSEDILNHHKPTPNDFSFTTHKTHQSDSEFKSAQEVNKIVDSHLEKEPTSTDDEGETKTGNKIETSKCFENFEHENEQISTGDDDDDVKMTTGDEIIEIGEQSSECVETIVNDVLLTILEQVCSTEETCLSNVNKHQDSCKQFSESELEDFDEWNDFQVASADDDHGEELIITPATFSPGRQHSSPGHKRNLSDLGQEVLNQLAADSTNQSSLKMYEPTLMQSCVRHFEDFFATFVEQRVVACLSSLNQDIVSDHLLVMGSDEVSNVTSYPQLCGHFLERVARQQSGNKECNDKIDACAEAFSAACKLLVELSCFPVYCSSETDLTAIQSSSSLTGSDTIPEWLQALIVCCCQYHDFDIQSSAVGTLLDLVNLTISVLSESRRERQSGTAAVVVIPIITQTFLQAIESSDLYQVIAQSLWEGLQEEKYQFHQKIVDLFAQLHSLTPLPIPCEDVISTSLVHHDKGIRLLSHWKFSVFWHLSKNTQTQEAGHYSKWVRTFDRSLFIMLDSLRAEEPELRLTAKHWISHSLEHGDIGRIIEALLLVLLNPKTARVSIHYLHTLPNMMDRFTASQSNNQQNKQTSEESKQNIVLTTPGVDAGKPRLAKSLEDISAAVQDDKSSRGDEKHSETSLIKKNASKSCDDLFTEQTRENHVPILMDVPSTPHPLKQDSPSDSGTLKSDTSKPKAPSKSSTLKQDVPSKPHPPKQDVPSKSHSLKQEDPSKSHSLKQDVPSKAHSTSGSECESISGDEHKDTDGGEADDEHDERDEHEEEVGKLTLKLDKSQNSSSPKSAPAQNKVPVHPLDHHRLFYVQLYDCKRTLYAFNVLNSILSSAGRHFICGAATASISGSSTAHQERIKELLIRHRRSLTGKGFYGPLFDSPTSPLGLNQSQLFSSTWIHTRPNTSKYLEILISVCLYFIRSQHLEPAASEPDEVSGNLQVQIASTQLLTRVLQEVVAVVRDSGSGFGSFIIDLLARCKVQKALLHCLVATVHNDSIHSGIKSKNTDDTLENENTSNTHKSGVPIDFDHARVFQARLLELIHAIFILEDSIQLPAYMPDISPGTPVPPESDIDASKAFNLQSSFRYVPGTPLASQYMLLSAALTALKQQQQCAVHHHWLQFVIMCLPYMGDHLSEWVVPVSEQICNNLRLLASNFLCGKWKKTCGMDCPCILNPAINVCPARLPADHVLTTLEELTAICHFCLLDNTPASPVLSLQPRSSSTSQGADASHSTVSSYQIFSNLLHAFGGNASPAKQSSGTDGPRAIIEAREELLSVLPRILSTLLTMWSTWGNETVSCGQRLPSQEPLLVMGGTKAVRQHILQLITPIAMNHTIIFLASIADVWNQRRPPPHETAATSGQVSAVTSSDQLVIVELVIAIKALSEDSIITTVKQMLRQVITGRDKINVNQSGLEVNILQFLGEYLSGIAQVALTQTRVSLVSLLRDALQLNLSPQALFLLLEILFMFVQRVSLQDDKKARKDLQDVTQRLLESCNTVAGSSLENSAWFRRSLLVVPTVDSGTDTSNGSTTDKGVGGKTSPGEANSTINNTPSSTSAQALWLLAKVLAPLLDAVFGSEEKERVTTLVTNVMYNVTPYLRNHSQHNLSSFRACSSLVASLSGYQYMRRAWRKDVFELLVDPSFFQMPALSMVHWRMTVDNLMTQDNTSFKDLMNRATITQTATINIFVNREQEMEQRAQLLKRLSFALFCSEPDQYQYCLPDIQERLAETLRLPLVPILHEQIFICFRVMLVRMSPHHLMSLWPVIVSELVHVFVQMESDLASDSMSPAQRIVLSESLLGTNGCYLPYGQDKWYALYLAACKLLDLCLNLSVDTLPHFQMYRWAFQGDNTGNSYESELLDTDMFRPYIERIIKLLETKSTSKQSRKQVNKANKGCKQDGTLHQLQSLNSLHELLPFFRTLVQDNSSLLNESRVKKAGRRTTVEKMIENDFLEMLPVE